MHIHMHTYMALYVVVCVLHVYVCLYVCTSPPALRWRSEYNSGSWFFFQHIGAGGQTQAVWLAGISPAEPSHWRLFVGFVVISC